MPQIVVPSEGETFTEAGIGMQPDDQIVDMSTGFDFPLPDDMSYATNASGKTSRRMAFNQEPHETQEETGRESV